MHEEKNIEVLYNNRICRRTWSAANQNFMVSEIGENRNNKKKKTTRPLEHSRCAATLCRFVRFLLKRNIFVYWKGIIRSGRIVSIFPVLFKIFGIINSTTKRSPILFRPHFSATMITRESWRNCRITRI